MKRTIKNALIWIYFFVFWCAPAVVNIEKKETILFLVSYLAGVVFLVVVKNKVLSFVMALVILLPSVFYCNDYLFFVVCPLCTIYEYIQIFKNKNEETTSDKFYIGANISIVLGAAVLVCQALTSFNNNDEHIMYRYKRSQAIVWAMFFVCLILATICISKKTQWNQISSKCGLSVTSLKELKYIHIANVVCYIETMILFYFVNEVTTEYRERIFFLPWMLYFVLMVYYEDPIFINLIEKAEQVFLKFVGKTAQGDTEGMQ